MRGEDIPNALSFYHFVNKRIENIDFLYSTTQEILLTHKRLTPLLENFLKIRGIRRFHHFEADAEDGTLIYAARFTSDKLEPIRVIPQ